MKALILRTVAAAALSGLFVGCGGPDGPVQVPVTGEVTLDGKPLEEGRILMRKVEGDGEAFSGEIRGGAYSLQAEPGKMSVEITASRIIPGKFDKANGTPEPVGEMYIPKKYNANTTLSAEVTPDGENQIPFVLASN